MLLVYSKVNQYALNRINFLAHTMQISPNFDKPLPFNFFVLPLRNGFFNVINKPTETTYELLTHDGKSFYTHTNHLILNYPKELSLFLHIQSYNEQNPGTENDCDRTVLIQKIYILSATIPRLMRKFSMMTHFVVTVIMTQLCLMMK